MRKLRTLVKSFKATLKRGKRHSTDDEKPMARIPLHADGPRGRIPSFNGSGQIDDEPSRPWSSGISSNTHSGSTTLASAQAGGTGYEQNDCLGLHDGSGGSDGSTTSQTRTVNEPFAPLGGLSAPPPRTSADTISHPERPLFDRSDSGDDAGGGGIGPAPGQSSGGGNLVAQSKSTKEGKEGDNGRTGSVVPTATYNESMDGVLHKAAYVSQPFYDQYDELHRILLSRPKGLNPTASIFQPDSTNLIVLSQDSTSDHERENRSLTNQQSTSRDGGDQWDRRRSAASLIFNERLEFPNHDSQVVTPMRTFLAGRIFTNSEGMNSSEVPWDGTLEESDILPSRAHIPGRGSIHADFVSARKSSADIPTTLREGSKSNEESKRKTNGVFKSCRPPNGHCDGPDHSDDEDSKTFKPVQRFTGPSNVSHEAPQNSVSVASEARNTGSGAGVADYENIIITEGVNPDPAYSVEEGFESYLRHRASPPSGLESLIRSYGSDFAGYISRYLFDSPSTLECASLHSLTQDEPFEFVGRLKREMPSLIRSKPSMLEGTNFSSSGNGVQVGKLNRSNAVERLSGVEEGCATRIMVREVVPTDG